MLPHNYLFVLSKCKKCAHNTFNRINYLTVAPSGKK